MIEMIHYQKEYLVESEEFKLVLKTAKTLLSLMNETNTYKLICEANVPKASSSKIQNCILTLAKDMGFQDEARGLFSSYENKLLRPDYFLKLSGSTGILLEVERGKTTINNMDLLDLWKCHICNHSNYLFLMVPRELKQSSDSPIRREFRTVSTRLKSFFIEGNYINVDGIFIFGY